MVEAIEELFIPVVVFNNIKGDDAELLKQFKEPSWNNPVTRFLDEGGNDVIAREDGVWTIQPMAKRMVAALETANQDVPTYLRLMASSQEKQKKATFAMHCYWEGEGKLGGIAGVSNTKSAWVGNLEVVEVDYDPAKVDYQKLLETAQGFDCASKVFTHDATQMRVAKAAVGDDAVSAPESSRTAKISDQKFYLRNTPGVRSLPLTTVQSTKINAALMKKGDFQHLLSPRQIKLLAQIEAYSSPKSAKSFDQFIFPEDDSALAEYDAKLRKHLDATKSPSK